MVVVLPMMVALMPVTFIGEGRRGEHKGRSQACGGEDEFLKHRNLLVKVSLFHAHPAELGTEKVQHL